MQPAVFIDRDGVINRNPPNYVKSWEEFLFLPGALAAFEKLSTLPWPIVIVTNQSVVGRGIIEESTLEGIHQRMVREITSAGGRVDGLYVCLHSPQDGCDCRKPEPGLLLRAASDMSLDLRSSVFLGDSHSDILAAVRARVQPVYRFTDGEEISITKAEPSSKSARIPAVRDLLEFSKMLAVAADERRQPADVIYYLVAGIAFQEI